MVLPLDAHRPRGERRPRRRSALIALEQLEERKVLNYSPIGFSPPDLTVVGEAPAVAAYGGPITVAVDVVNLGHSSMAEPLALPQGSASRADALPSVVGVYLSRNPRRLTRSSIRIGEIAVPLVPQNSAVELSQTFAMPAARPRGLPGNGGNLYVFFRVDERRQAIDIDRTNNLQRAPEPVQLAPPLPQLETIGLDVPPVMQPGDAIQPSFKIANYGTTPVLPQGPVIVQLVASTDQNYGPTDVVLATYSIPDILPFSAVPTRGPTVLGDVNLDDPENVVTVIGDPVQLPPGPAIYNLGLVVDPLNQIREISEVVTPPGPGLQEIQRIGPPIAGLPPAGQVREPAPTLNSFPIPAFSPIRSSYQPNDTFGFFDDSLTVSNSTSDLNTVRARRAEALDQILGRRQSDRTRFPGTPPTID